MKSSESFNRKLELLGTGNPEAAELSDLQKSLQQNATKQERSDQHQSWAWTRLREELQNPSSLELPAWKRFFLPSLAGVALLALGVYFLSGPASDLLIDSTGSDLYAQTFKSGDAEVVWVTGYSYIPSSYSLK